MREILPNQLWIGNAGDARDPEGLLRVGVEAVINLAAEEPSPVLPRMMTYCHFLIVDGAPDDQATLRGDPDGGILAEEPSANLGLLRFGNEPISRRRGRCPRHRSMRDARGEAA